MESVGHYQHFCKHFCVHEAEYTGIENTECILLSKYRFYNTVLVIHVYIHPALQCKFHFLLKVTVTKA